MGPGPRRRALGSNARSRRYISERDIGKAGERIREPKKRNDGKHTMLQRRTLPPISLSLLILYGALPASPVKSPMAVGRNEKRHRTCSCCVAIDSRKPTGALVRRLRPKKGLRGFMAPKKSDRWPGVGSR